MGTILFYISERSIMFTSRNILHKNFFAYKQNRTIRKIE
jgi:hypothetical protein